MGNALTFEVYGDPGPQGSKSFKGMLPGGGARLVESSKKVAPWRQAVAWAAVEAMRNTPEFERITGPCGLLVEFYLHRPSSAPKTRRVLPAKQPDQSKLLRSTEDALTTAGVYHDDALIVDSAIRKRYVRTDNRVALPWEQQAMGARITVYSIDPELTWGDVPLSEIPYFAAQIDGVQP